ncbi:MAG: hypothetical protein QOD93_7469, partial [Acetobacteraceae bacterium]|nr:hypothetical protein [Acetobacteraceae bacterium]
MRGAAEQVELDEPHLSSSSPGFDPAIPADPGSWGDTRVKPAHDETKEISADAYGLGPTMTHMGPR